MRGSRVLMEMLPVPLRDRIILWRVLGSARAV
jgi:hypothetical protein